MLTEAMIRKQVAEAAKKGSTDNALGRFHHQFRNSRLCCQCAISRRRFGSYGLLT